MLKAKSNNVGEESSLVLRYENKVALRLDSATHYGKGLKTLLQQAEVKHIRNNHVQPCNSPDPSISRTGQRGKNSNSHQFHI